MALRTLIFATAAMVVAVSVHAGEEVLFGPVPDWVEALPDAAAPAEESSLPVRVLSMDAQRRMEGDRTITYTAVALEFQTPQGLSAGNLSLPWRADNDDLTVHKVLIRRGDEVIDVLGSGQTFTVLRREQNLEMAMLDGVLTANMFPEGLQVGDVLELASTLVSTDPVLAGHSEAVFGPLNAPIGRAHLRLQWPSSVKLRLTKSNDLPEWHRTRAGGFESAALTLDDIEPIPVPADAPLRYHLVRFIEASDFSSWAELAEIFVPLYEAAAEVPAEGPLRAEIERIRNASLDPVRRAEAALELVQSRIRYVALAMGTGGLVPANATETWSRRYGECKAKTALLLAILEELGIEAEAVVVNSGFGDGLNERLPTASAFDHVLVRAQIGGRGYWLDGTRTGDTSLARLRVPHFSWGLPIRKGAELVRMVPEPVTEPDFDLAISMDAGKGVHAKVPTSIELTLRGDGALGTHQLWANLVGEARERELRKFWRQKYDFVEPGKVGMAFDKQSGEVRLTLEGQATLDWKGGRYETDETGVGYRADFAREPGYGSDAPFVVNFPFYTRTRQTILLPAGFAVKIDEDAAVDETVAGVEYKRHATLTGNTFFVERTQRSVAPEFAARDAPAAQKRLRELASMRVYLRIPVDYRPTEADLAIALTEEPDSIEGLISGGQLLLDSARYDEALVRFRRAAELAPDNAYAWAHLGLTLAWTGQLADATDALDKADALDGRNAVVYRGRGLVAGKRHDAVAAIQAFSTALELDPESTFAWAHRAMAQMSADRPEQALEDAAEALVRSPNYIDMYVVRAFALDSLGRRDEAAAEVDAMLAANPDDPVALTAAGYVYVNLDFPDKAQAIVSRSMESGPSPITFYNQSRLRESSDTEGRLADLDEALRLGHDYVPALADRASLRSANGDTDGALEDIARAIELDPGQSELYRLQANIARSGGRKETALSAAAALETAMPGDAYSHVVAGKIYAAFGLRREALQAIDRALAVNAEPYIYVNRSEVREPADFESRLADIDEALRLDPGFRPGLIAKAQLVADKGDLAAAAQLYGEALEIANDDPGLLTRRAIALTRLGRTEEAEHDFSRARELAVDARALNNICYEKAAAAVALDRALDECNESLRLRPGDAPTLDSRGTVLLQMGRLDDAIRDFDEALEKSPNKAPSLYGRAVAWSRKGNPAKSRVDEQAALVADPDVADRMARYGLVVVRAEEL